MQPLVSLNGQLLAPSATTISPFDRGLLLGDGLFETIKVTRSGPWYLERHFTRLRAGAQRLGIIIPQQLQQWTNELVEAALAANSGDLALRITITRGGTAPHSLSALGGEWPALVVIAAFDAPAVLPRVYEFGITANIASGPRNERSVIAGLKTTSYAESIAALRAAQEAGFDDTIFLDTNGFVSEASSSNVFIVLNDTLITPAITHGILPGITREVILELAAELKVPATQREVLLEELLSASEAFLTSSLKGIVPLIQVNHYVFGSGTPGSLTHRISREYNAKEFRT